MRQAQPVWRTKSYNFKREAWEGNVLFFFKYFLKLFLKLFGWSYLSLRWVCYSVLFHFMPWPFIVNVFVQIKYCLLSIWLMAVPFILPMPLFRPESRSSWSTSGNRRVTLATSETPRHRNDRRIQRCWIKKEHFDFKITLIISKYNLKLCKNQMTREKRMLLLV
jgi:hypothetical protein